VEKVTDLKTEPIIGKFYLVPHVLWRYWWVPIIGEPHTDADLGISATHYHYDLRFLADDELFDPIRPNRNNVTREESTLARVLTDNAFRPGVEFKRRKCRHRMADFKWLPEIASYRRFHDAYIGRSVKCGKCPHRQMPLESLPRDAAGNVICNGHGLKINLITNQVVERNHA
jgi:hypothetical protein